MHRVLISVGLMALLVGTTAPARADLIDFEAQGSGALSFFTGFPDSPLVIGNATFTGGQLLFQETIAIDSTAVYGTAFFGGPGYTNPLTILFSEPVSGFNVQVTNEGADVYTVADNLGGSQSSVLGMNDPHLFSLPDTGITSVTISGASPFWDFAIDNVGFAPTGPPPGSPVPEPAGIVPLISVLGFTTLSAGIARRKGLIPL